MTPEPFDAPKKRSGFRVFLYVLFALAGLLLLTCGAGVYYFTQTEQGKKLANAAGEAKELAETAMKAPGAAELRDLGCDTALVMQLSEMADMIEAFAPDESIPEEASDTTMVMCQMNLFGGDPPGCDEVVATYIDAATPSSVFMVAVSKGRGSIECEGLFDPDGNRVE